MTALNDASAPPRLHTLGPHGLAQRVDCRVCRAGVDRPCHDDGEVRENPHHSRWMRYQRLARRQPFLALATRDLPPLAHSGDALLCTASGSARHVEVIGDRQGQLLPEPVTADADAVEFLAFLDERPGLRSIRRLATGA